MVWNPEWAISQDGSAFINTINEKGKSSVHDAVSVFWILNTKLPSSKRFAYLPMPSYKDNFCMISENHLLKTILRRSTNVDLRKKLESCFGSQTKAVASAQSSPGELYRKLFFHGKKTNYNRHAVVANPSDNSVPRLLDLNDIIDQQTRSDLDTYKAGTSEYEDAKNKVKQTVADYLLNMKRGDYAGKYVLTGTLLTDGYQLKVHAYSLVRRKKCDRDDQSSSQKASPCHSTRSKLKYLQTLIPDKDRLLREFPNQSNYAVLAIDPGIKNTATAVIVDSLLPGKSWNLSFAQGCHNWNSQRRAMILRRLKKVKQYEDSLSINDVQARILSIDCGDPKEHDLSQQFMALQQSYEKHSISVLSVEEILRSFYGSSKSKIGRYRMEQGEKAEVGRAIAGMLKVIRDRVKSDQRKAIVAIGDGNFKGRKGVGVKASKFISTLQNQV